MGIPDSENQKLDIDPLWIYILGTENFFRGNLSDGEPLQYQQEDFDFGLDVLFYLCSGKDLV
jgi:hypothetical protein